jgi:N-acetylmuramoyl-L-alanine amidase
MKIYLSPSTQEHNIGCKDYGTEEKRMNQLADILAEQLYKNDYIVFRNTPSMTLSQIVADSDTKKPDLHLALHSNAHKGKTRGCLIFCHKFGGKGEQYARAIYKHLSALTPTDDLSIKEGYNYYGEGKPIYETAYTDAPAVLIEVAFHDNEADAQWIIDNMKSIAIAITNGLNEVSGIAPLVNDYKTKYEVLLEEHKALITSIIKLVTTSK